MTPPPPPPRTKNPRNDDEIVRESLELELGPAMQWGLVQTQGSDEDSINELNFSLPITAYFSPGAKKETGTYEENTSSNTALSRLFIIQARPYFQTDLFYLSTRNPDGPPHFQFGLLFRLAWLLFPKR
jgi:hypothetical protein